MRVVKKATLPKIFQFYLTYRKFKKIFESRDTHPWVLLYQEIQIQIVFWYIISNSFNFFWTLQIVLINIVTTLIMSEKLATLGLFKINFSRIKIMTLLFLLVTSPTKLYHLVYIILYMWSCDKSLVNLAFLWEKLS